MTGTLDNAVADLRRTVVELQQKLHERTSERDEALAQQTATAEVLQVINASPGDLAPVFDAMLEKATRLCEAAFGVLWIRDAEGFRAAALRGVPPSFEDLIRTPVQPHPETGLGRILSGESLVINFDLAAGIGPTDGTPERALAGLEDGCWSIEIALRKDEILLGALTVYRREVRPFSDKQVALVKSFASQAVIAMENARLITETREALEQQTATAEVLQVINASPGDPAPVFDAILEKAARLCDANSGIFWKYDGELFHGVAVHGAPQFTDFVRDNPQRSPPASDLGRLLQGEDVIHRADYAAGSHANVTLNRAFVDLAGGRAGLLAALRKDDVLLGAIRIFRQEVRPFSDKQIALLQNFAAQAVIAMENARLITEQHEALEQQTATAEVLQVINASPGDLAAIFDAMIERAVRLCAADQGVLRTFDGEVFPLAAIYGHDPDVVEQVKQLGPIRIFGHLEPIARGEGVVHVADVRETDTYRDHAIARERLDLAGIRTWLAVALRKDGALLGTIIVYRKSVRPFTDKEIALLQNFAAQAVIAMENARLITETREALEQQTATSEVLRVISSSPGDLESVFNTMIESATRLCEAKFGMMALYDGEGFRGVAVQGMPKSFAEDMSRVYKPGPGTGMYVVQQTKKIQQILDVAAEPAYDYVRAATPEFALNRTVLHVPMVKKDELVGVIAVFRQEVRPFSEKQIALVENFAAQAVIAMENARLIAETREALEQQTATAEVLQVINSSPGDLAPVFDAILEKAHSLCDAPFGELQIYDGEYFRAVAVRGVPEPFAKLMREPWRPPPHNLLAAILRGERLVHVRDVAAIESDDPIRRAAVELGGVRTLLVVPLRKDDALLGVIIAYRQAVRPFSDKQIALLQNFAAQAVIAMENARLITEQREALEQQTATAEVLQVINSSPGDLAPVFDAMLDKAMHLCEAAIGIMFTLDGEFARMVASRNVPEPLRDYLAEHPPGIGPETFFGRAILERAVLHATDMTVEEPYLKGVPLAVAAVDRAGIRAVLMAPLVKDDTVLGVFAIFRREVRPFSDKQIALLQNFAAQAVIATENARLLGELRQRTSDLEESLEYQTATSDVLKVISRSTFDLRPVLETVVATAAQLCKAEKAIIYRYENGAYRFAAGHSNEPDYERIERETPIYPGEGTVAGRAALRQCTVQILDPLTDPLYAAKDEARIGNARTMIGVPLMREGAPIGVIALARGRVEAFTDKEMELVTVFADQAVIAIENARLLTEIRAARDAAEEASRTIDAAYRDLKAAQANLIQAEKMASLGQLTAGIAHEIKNPLNFVNNFANLSVELLDELKETTAPAIAALGEDKRAEIDETMVMLTSNLEKIAEHGRRADGIVKSMLEHSRGGTGECRSVDLNGLIEEALNLAYHGARAQDQSFNITLERDFADAIAPIELVPQDITRVCLNLFGNGFYAATKRRRDAEPNFQPVLKVSTRDLGDAVEIRVRDNGVGIAPEIKDKLFEPFFTTKPTGEGTGLGLSISYDIVTQEHGGTIEVDSRVGEFTEFTVRLPRAAQPISSFRDRPEGEARNP